MTPFALDHPLVRDYLRRLEQATFGMPPDERADIHEGIRAHLLEALSESSSDADVRNALETLGDPYDIVGSAPAPASASRRGALEVAAVVLLLIGAFIVPVVGWIVGVVLLWSSRAWTVGQKLLGTFVLPGGMAGVLLVWVLPARWPSQACTTVTGEGMQGATLCAADSAAPPWLVIPVAVVLLLAPIVTAVYLLRTAARPAAGVQDAG